MRRFRLALVAVVLVLGVAACTQNDKDTRQSAQDVVREEQQATARGFQALTKSQAVPVFDYSDERQTLIDILTLRANGTHGTASAWTLNGELLWWCPTSGPPIPSTYQLTGSTQWVDIPGDKSRERFQMDQGEQTGVYVGDSAATWTTCLDDNGNAFGQYEEANVRWTGAEVSGLPNDKRARADEITFEFSQPPENVNEG